MTSENKNRIFISVLSILGAFIGYFAADTHPIVGAFVGFFGGFFIAGSLERQPLLFFCLTALFFACFQGLDSTRREFNFSGAMETMLVCLLISAAITLALEVKTEGMSSTQKKSTYKLFLVYPAIFLSVIAAVMYFDPKTEYSDWGVLLVLGYPLYLAFYWTFRMLFDLVKLGFGEEARDWIMKPSKDVKQSIEEIKNSSVFQGDRYSSKIYKDKEKNFRSLTQLTNHWRDSGFICKECDTYSTQSFKDVYYCRALGVVERKNTAKLTKSGNIYEGTEHVEVTLDIKCLKCETPTQGVARELQRDSETLLTGLQCNTCEETLFYRSLSNMKTRYTHVTKTGQRDFRIKNNPWYWRSEIEIECKRCEEISTRWYDESELEDLGNEHLIEIESYAFKNRLLDEQSKQYV
jgi:hypothetical protein